VPYADSPAAPPPAGELVLDRYRLLRRLGSGGMGVVFLARDERLQRDVAVKRIALDGAEGLDQRAEREAIAAARLSHPGIVALFEAGRDDEAVYLVSELVRGRTLSELERRGELSDRDVLRIGITLCDALEHAHARGVIHRDVKPSNVLCPEVPDEGGGVAKLADLGIARLADADALTRTGDIVGTLAYMAPEQARGEPLTGAADAYALGLVLYEALAGVNPIRAGNAAATVRRVGMRVPPLGGARGDLPPALSAAIDAMVEADPRDRAPLGELREALADALPAVDDEPGVIAGSALEGLRPPDRTEVAPRSRWRQRPAARPAPRPQPAPAPLPLPLPVHGPPPAFEAEPEPRRLRARATLPERALAAAAAAALMAAALGTLAPDPPVTPAAGAAGAALVVALLPRLGWLAGVGLVAGWLAGTYPGLALLVGAAAAPVVLLLPLTGWTWSLPAVAPGLGVAALAGAWPALAGQPRRWPVRAALGALGLWWLLLAELVSGERLLLGAAAEAPPRPGWEGSAVDAARDALWPVVTSGALAVAALWGLAAALLPVLVRGRSVLADLVGVAFWAAALAAGTQAVAQAMAVDDPRGLVPGALACATVAVGARAVRGRV
jgi:hypothetical protein